MGYRISEKNGDTIIEDVRDFDLSSTLECGQCFRWDKNDYNDYTGVVSGKVVRVIQKENSIIFRKTKAYDVNDFWYSYFDLATDYGEIKSILSKNDGVMKKAVAFAPGIRILRQPFFETLISFIISANNSIPNIKKVIAALSKMWGSGVIYDKNEYFSFPESNALAKAEVCDLKLTKAGYRCDYIKKTSQMINSDNIDEKILEAMDYDSAKQELLKFHGVGSKVADCTLLFSGTHLRSFPVDVWIKKIMEKLYIKEEVPLSKINLRAYELFGDLAGYAQQYLFHYARMNKISKD